jgi:hypothetical protein
MKFLLSLLILITGITQAQMANHPPVPQWLSVADDQAVRIETRFEQTTPLLKAILLLATDTEAEVARFWLSLEKGSEEEEEEEEEDFE